MEQSKRLDLLKLSAASFAEGDTLSAQAQSELIAALEGADLPTYTAAREVWVTAYTSERAERGSPIDPESAGKAWRRLCNAAGVEKPRATTPEATEKAAKRAEAAAKLASLSDVAILEEIAGHRAAAMDGNVQAAQRIKTLHAEQARRVKAAEESEAETTKALRAEVVALVKAADHSTLELVRAILKGEVEVTASEEAPEATRIAA